MFVLIYYYIFKIDVYYTYIVIYIHIIYNLYLYIIILTFARRDYHSLKFYINESFDRCKTSDYTVKGYYQNGEIFLQTLRVFDVIS